MIFLAQSEKSTNKDETNKQTNISGLICLLLRLLFLLWVPKRYNYDERTIDVFINDSDALNVQCTMFQS